MSVRATNSLIAELVKVSALPDSPAMIVQSVNEAEKTVTAVWFSDSNEFQQGLFPAAGLDRVEIPVKSAGAKAGSKKK
jgi:hypothetical protein